MKGSSLKVSTWRLAAGGLLALLGAGVFTLALPRATGQRDRGRAAAAQARAVLERTRKELEEAQAERRRLQDNRAALEEVMANLPSDPVGRLTWRLSQELFTLATEHGVHLRAVKYGAPAKEGTRGMPLESVDVDFAATGLFPNLKAFMLALEKGRLPFAVVSAKLDESPDGAQLAIVLRAFRQTSPEEGTGGHP